MSQCCGTLALKKYQPYLKKDAEMLEKEALLREDSRVEEINTIVEQLSLLEELNSTLIQISMSRHKIHRGITRKIPKTHKNWVFIDNTNTYVLIEYEIKESDKMKLKERFECSPLIIKKNIKLNSSIFVCSSLVIIYQKIAVKIIINPEILFMITLASLGLFIVSIISMFEWSNKWGRKLLRK